MTPRKSAASARAAALLAEDVERQLKAIERAGGDGLVDMGRGKTLKVSSLGKMFFPEAGVTKGALMRYYARIWTQLQPVVLDRALILKRYPDGAAGPMFFQQNAGDHVPDIVRVEVLQTKDEGPQPRIVGGDLATMLYTVQLGAIEVHPWLSRVGDIESADRCLIDLDPGKDVEFGQVVELAREVLKITERCGIPTGVKTSGSRGIHLVIPLPAKTSYDTSARLATLIAEAVVMQRPDLATTERSIKARPKGTIYVDAMQNARGKSMASAYSVRAKPEAPVSAPLQDRELTARLRLSAFTVKSVPARVAKAGDVWEEAMQERPTARALSKAMSALEKVQEQVLEQGEDDEATVVRRAPRTAAKRSRAGGAGGGAAAGRRTKRRA